MKRLVILMAGLALVAGCTTGPSKQEYEVISTALQGSKALRNELTTDCARKLANKPIPASIRKEVVAFFNTTEANLPGVVCRRMVNGLANGTLSYQDYKDMERGRMTPEIVQLLQGTR
ncbi:hypothetical protein GGR30_001357 [Martelella radicis]|uniref:Lipoprotein n=2 Tax=Martelella radicis TaxID=1397476 RepID=A0A7W6KHK9_9HYPH|nr:hypothetical protein [Martelella radicis]